MARKKTKVLHVIRDLRCGGVEKLFLSIIDGLQKRGATDNVGCVMSDKLDFLAPSKAKIITPRLPLNDSFFRVVLMLPFEFFMLMASILRENPDVIFVHNTSAEQLLTSMLGVILRKKVVVLKCEQNDNRHILRRFTDPLNYSLCHRIVVLSHATENELLSLGIPRSKLSLILNGKQIGRHMLTQNDARLRLGFKRSDLLIGMISRTHPLKNHAGVIRAMPELVALRKNIKLVIVGDDAEARYKQTLQQLVHDGGLDGSVVFLGERKDVEKIFPAFDIFVHPSFSEAGCPLAVLEAASAGLPMVLGRVGGLKDLPQGCAMMIQPTDERALMDALKKLINNPGLRQEYGEKARAMVRDEFSFDAMLDGYENLFKRL